MRTFFQIRPAVFLQRAFPPRRSRPAVRPPKKAQPLNLRRRSEKYPPPNRQLCGLPHRKKKPAPATALPKTKKRAALGAPLTIIVKTIFWSAFQSVPRFLRRAFLTPCGAFLCGRLAPRSHGGRTSAPRKPRRPICGFAACRTAGEVLPQLSPETKKRAALGALFNDYCKNYILVGVPKRTPHPIAAAFPENKKSPLLRAFFQIRPAVFLRQAFPPRRSRPAVRPPKKAQPLNLRRRSEKYPPPNRRLCGLPHRRGKIRRPAGEVLPQLSPKTKKRAALGALFSDYCKIIF